MTRLVGEHFKRSGSPKRRFNSRRAALDFLTSTGQTERFHIYRCDFCGGWHLATARHGDPSGAP